ncbi:MAG TPA: two-component sensor histidine kinase, partial [Saliniramus sp.]|nr:two-component sensor histidine kinase [Saliniramus sp.]
MKPDALEPGVEASEGARRGGSRLAFSPRQAFERVGRGLSAGWDVYVRGARWFASLMPKGLYARSLISIIAPIVLLQSVIAYVFMERHWQTVTIRLSSAVTADIAAMIDIYETYPQDDSAAELTRIASQRLGLDIEILRDAELPPPGPKPFFSILDQALSSEIARQVARPFWIDTVGRSNLIEIRIMLDDAIMRVYAQRSQAYASNSHIFLVWMGATSLVLMGIAVLFLRNQIRPILRLADAAESFGKGRDV